MEIKINLQENSSHISNLAFMKALMIKQAIEELNVSYEEKGRLRKEVLEYLKKTWNKSDNRVRITQKNRRF